LRWFNPDLGSIATGYAEKVERPDEHRRETWDGRHEEPIRYVRHVGVGDQRVSIRIDQLDDCTLDATGLHTPADLWIAEQATLAKSLESSAKAANRDRSASREHRPDIDPGEGVPHAASPHDAVPKHAPVAPPPRPPRVPHNPLDHPCPYCKGKIKPQTEWPDWYRPPSTATEVLICSGCELVVGSR
jgi:hypothetical protein